MANKLILNIKKRQTLSYFPVFKETDSFNNLKVLSLECKEFVKI